MGSTTSNLQNAWSYSRGAAPRPRYVDDRARTLLQINPIGFYQGVTPTGDHPPPFPASNFGVMPSVLTWTGFKRGGGNTSQVFVQLSAAVVYELETSTDKVIVRLPNTTVNVKNNRRRLDTRFFITPVKHVDIRPTGLGTDVVITLRRPALPAVHSETVAGGYTMLVLSFGNEAAESAVSGDATNRRAWPTQLAATTTGRPSDRR
ncbi:MAG: AMIN domain-containing protein [Nannocystaceae bacterium]